MEIKLNIFQPLKYIHRNPLILNLLMISNRVTTVRKKQLLEITTVF